MENSQRTMVFLQNSRSAFWIRAAALIRCNGHILVQRAVGDVNWALPGGRIELHETGAEAVAREIREELGISATIGTLRFVIENFYGTGKRIAHSLGLYYDADPDSRLRFHETDVIHRCEDEGKIIEFRWAPAKQSVLADLDLRPAILCELIERAPDGVIHAVCRTTDRTIVK